MRHKRHIIVNVHYIYEFCNIGVGLMKIIVRAYSNVCFLS